MDDKLDMLINLMDSVGNTLKKNTSNIENVGTSLKTHIDKYNNDIDNIHEQLAKIEINARNIKKNADDIVDLVNDIKTVKDQSKVLEAEVKETVVGLSEKTERNNKKITDEIEKRPSYEEVEVKIKEAITKETAHLHELIKNLVSDAHEKNEQVKDKEFPELDIAANRRSYAKSLAHNQTGVAFQPAGTSSQRPQVSARQSIRNTFDGSSHVQALVHKHKQIVGIKPIARAYLNFHATDCGISNPEAIHDNNLFYCPSYHSFRMSFVKDFLFEVFGYDKDQIPLTDVKMANNLSSQIMWITVG